MTFLYIKYCLFFFIFLNLNTYIFSSSNSNTKRKLFISDRYDPNYSEEYVRIRDAQLSSIIYINSLQLINSNCIINSYNYPINLIKSSLDRLGIKFMKFIVYIEDINNNSGKCNNQINKWLISLINELKLDNSNSNITMTNMLLYEEVDVLKSDIFIHIGSYLNLFNSKKINYSFKYSLFISNDNSISNKSYDISMNSYLNNFDMILFSSNDVLTDIMSNIYNIYNKKNIITPPDYTLLSIFAPNGNIEDAIDTIIIDGVMHSIFKKFVINNLHLYREQIINSNSIVTSNRNNLAIIIEPRYCKY
jgi:hypothetical protein